MAAEIDPEYAEWALSCLAPAGNADDVRVEAASLEFVGAHELAVPRPELAWFVEATQGPGRPNLTREVMLPRRNEFLRNALRFFG